MSVSIDNVTQYVILMIKLATATAVEEEVLFCLYCEEGGDGYDGLIKHSDRLQILSLLLSDGFIFLSYFFAVFYAI